MTKLHHGMRSSAQTDMWDLLFDWSALVERGYDAAVYLVMAVVSTLLFLIRLGISMVGGDADSETGFDTDAAFTIFSVLSILAFFMGAGWMGLAARLDWELGQLASSLLAAGFGVAMMSAAAGMSHAARRLDRAVEYDLRSAVGRTARVYLTIPPAGHGTGQVEVSVSGRRKVVRAASAGPRLETASRERQVEVALALAARDVLLAEKEQELARLEKSEVAQQMIQRQKIEIDAEAEAERIRRIARGEADAILAKYAAEAEGLRKVLEAKAAGYERLLSICAERPDLAPALLVIEKLPDLVAEQVKAIQNLKIDKITVWDSGTNGHTNGAGGSTSHFLRGLIGSLPPIHDLAQQAGIDLPEMLGRMYGAKPVADPLIPPVAPMPTIPASRVE